MLQIVRPFLLVAPCHVKCLYGNIRIDTFLLNHVSADYISSPIQPMSAMNTDHLVLLHALYGFIELLHDFFGRNFMAFGEYFAILDTMIFKPPALIISTHHSYSKPPHSPPTCWCWSGPPPAPTGAKFPSADQDPTSQLLALLFLTNPLSTGP